MSRNIPMPGEYYRHFKGNLYEIITVASHTESEERLVVYRALYGSRKDYARPLTMFMSEVDREKYPDAPQQYRFEKVGDCVNGMDAEKPAEIDSEEGKCTADLNPVTHADETAENTNHILIEFLNAEGLQQKLEVIRENRTKVDQRFIDGAAMALDIVIDKGDVDDRLRILTRKLQLMAQYETRRLR